MEEQSEILAAIRKLEIRFDGVDSQFAKLRREFVEQLDGVSDGFHVDMRDLKRLIVEKASEARIADEGLDSKINLVAENIANVAKEIARYHAAVEVPHEQRVNALDARVFKLEEKMGGTAAESPRRS